MEADTSNSLNKAIVSNSALQRQNTKSTVTISKIYEWLNKQKGPEDSSVNRNNFITTIKNNLIENSLLAQEWGNEEFLVSVPIKAHNSKHDDGKNSSPYLVLFEDDKGEIRRGELAIVTSDFDKINQDQLIDLYLNNNIGFQGSLKLISFQDFNFFETYFEGNIKSTESSYGERLEIGECIHWYHLHVEYNILTGEVIDWYIQDLGCSSCPPTALCDQFSDYDNEFGGGSIPAQVMNARTVTMFGEHEPGSYNDYNVWATYNVSGIRNRNPNLSTFTGLALNANSVAPLWTAGAILITSTNWYYFTIDQNNLVHNETFTNTSATATMTCILHYPNQNIPSGIDKAKTGYHIFTPPNI